MGKAAAQTVLRQITDKQNHINTEIVFEPELIVRGTTAAARTTSQSAPVTLNL
jgi:DNA-binding LacI/PurR family transcriptional regulator